MPEVNMRALSKWMTDVSNRLVSLEQRLEALEAEQKRKKGGRPRKEPAK